MDAKIRLSKVTADLVNFVLVKKQNLINMIRKFIYLIGLIVIVAFAWFYFINKNSDNKFTSDTQPLEVSKHSDAFRASIGSLMSEYYEMNEAFVNWDSSSVILKSESLMLKMADFSLVDIKSDSLIFEAAQVYLEKSKNQLGNLVGTGTLAEKRKFLNELTPILYDFLRIVQFDNDKVYLMECPMAFNDEESGYWLNKTSDVRNPYLGTSHPKYRKTMLECGLAKDTINFLSHNIGNN